MKNQISLYLDGELTGEALRRFESHLEECGECREEVEQYNEMLQGLSGLMEREVPAALKEKLHAALVIEAEKGAGKVKRKLNPWAMTAAAAVLCVCLVGGAMLLKGMPLASRLADDDGMRNSMDIADSAYGTDGNARVQSGEAAPAATAAAEAVEAPAINTESQTTSKALDTAGKTDSSMYSIALRGLKSPENQTMAGKDGRKLIYNAGLVLETREFDLSMNKVKALVAKYSGYVEHSQTNGVSDAKAGNAGRSASISLRLPISSYGDAMQELEGMGNLLNKTENTEDVSRQYVDTDARNKTLTMQRAKLYELLEKADKMENIIALENEITRLTTEIEQMTAQLRFWDDKVAFSTITVDLIEIKTPKSVKPADPDLATRMNGAFYKTINDMKQGMEDLSVGIMGALPYIILIVVVMGILSAVTVPLARRAARNAKKNKIEGPKEE